jgi:hypothetical protein
MEQGDSVRCLECWKLVDGGEMNLVHHMRGKDYYPPRPVCNICLQGEGSVAYMEDEDDDLMEGVQSEEEGPQPGSVNQGGGLMQRGDGSAYRGPMAGDGSEGAVPGETGGQPPSGSGGGPFVPGATGGKGAGHWGKRGEREFIRTADTATFGQGPLLLEAMRAQAGGNPLDRAQKRPLVFCCHFARRYGCKFNNCRFIHQKLQPRDQTDLLEGRAYMVCEYEQKHGGCVFRDKGHHF